MITDTPTEADIRGWFGGRVPAGLFEDIVEIAVDRDEITVVGRIEAPAVDEGAADSVRSAAIDGKAAEFRERTRDERMAIARDAEHRFDRKVSWGVKCAGERRMFTTLSVPAMTRLRQPERQVLDLLVDGGVARSRSDALAWCVRLVQRNTDEWLTELRESLAGVEAVRARGPQ